MQRQCRRGQPFTLFSSLNLSDIQQFQNKKGCQPKLTTLFLQPAEREGFEPPDPRRSTVFKTAAFDRSAIFPFRAAKLRTFRRIDKFLLDRPTRAGDYKLQISRLKKRLKSRSILQNNSDQRKATP